MVEGTTTLVFELDGGSRTIVVQGVPALICDQCGDAFIPAESARQVETLVKKSEEDGVRAGFVQFSKAA